MLSDDFRPCEDFFSKLPFRCWFALCCQENEKVTTKQSILKQKKKKKKKESQLGLEPVLVCLISTGAKTLTACATQALHRIIMQIERRSKLHSV